MKLVDVHAHLESSRFDEDIEEVIERFKEAGGEVVVNSGVNPATNRRVLEMCDLDSVMKCSFGLFPIDCIASDLKMSSEESDLREVEVFDLDEELDWIREHASECLAIGEVGLDFADEEVKGSDELKEKQRGNFRKILGVVKELGKAVVVHTRKAEADCIEILSEAGCMNVVLHCFHGNKKLIKRGVELGYSFSVPPNITRLLHFKMLVEMVPLEQLLTETDAPYNSPVAGERNEPANVLVTLKEIARIKGLGVEEVGRAVYENFLRVFNL
ncbi:MAG: TatD family hydrolase [Nanoarchaeota archaeon]|nr:TatD family hydrolase [Nanoarchaeota archaeon]